MKTCILAAAVAIAVLATVIQATVLVNFIGVVPKCEEANTEFWNCNNNCTNKCPTHPPEACSLLCQQGCFCKQGYRRGPDGTCIETKDCPVTCPENTSFKCVCSDACGKELVHCAYCHYMCGCDDDFRRIHGVCEPKEKCLHRPKSILI